MGENKIRDIINNDELTKNEKIEYIKNNYKNDKLTPTELGDIYKIVADVNETTGFSKEISIKELVEINSNFRSNNGCQWARSDNSPLGKQYKIQRNKERNKVSSVQLVGINDSLKKYRGINTQILKSIKGKRCSVLDISTNIECDHKNGRYNDKCNKSTSTQKEDDFQPLCKTVNDAKRSHCKKCLESGKRYKASILGYCVDFTKGDENSDFCEGCYWYDTKAFNHNVSINANKAS